ncbi:universal stress protein [Jiella sp. M17.18]|uniref:universal stress protein n=1 Tax=Jiella sp. M17.18 TaxID=3234247 RepID=UPI0034DF409C
MTMYRKIMVPVDLAHTDTLGKALKTAADLARLYGASVTYVGVTMSTPGPVAKTPEEFDRQLRHFAGEEASRHGIEAAAKSIVVHDAAVDLNHALLHAVEDIEADLVVMASHRLGFPDHFFASHASTVAQHADVSVLVVR